MINHARVVTMWRISTSYRIHSKADID